MNEKSIIVSSGIDIANPIHASIDSENTILSIIKNKFEKKCHSSENKTYFIMEVMEIVGVTPMEIVMENSAAIGRINNVQFRARVNFIHPGDILNGLVIQNIASTAVILRREPIRAYIGASQSLTTLKKGQQIPIMVMAASFISGDEDISVNAVPYFESISSSAVYIDGNVEADDVDFVKSMYANIPKETDEMIKTMDTKTKTRYEIYKNLFYAYKTPPETKFESVSVEKFLSEFSKSKLKPGWYFRSNVSHLSDDIIHRVDNKEDLPADIKTIEGISSAEKASIMLDHYRKNVNFIVEFSVLYDENMLKSHSSLIAIIKNRKR